jgi:hypothetical protein
LRLALLLAHDTYFWFPKWVKIDKAKAAEILEQASRSLQPPPSSWTEVVEQLGEECEKGANKTFIAVLGTALLAKATDLRVDPFALKVGSGESGAYSARSLCQHVLAAQAPELGIDLGVTGREPFNNQPFFAEERIHKGLPVHARARIGFDVLLDALQRVSDLNSESDARNALLAFVKVRTKPRYAGSTAFDGSGIQTPELLASYVEDFVTENSESGKRAQAAAAGILEMAAPGAVQVSKVHDPDRNYPGDVRVADGDIVHTVFEVRDKRVERHDLFHFVQKVASTEIKRAGVIAIGNGQPHLEPAEIEIFSQAEGIHVFLIYSWRQLIDLARYHSLTDPRGSLLLASEGILRHSVSLEVSESGIRSWENLSSKGS